MVGDIDQSIYSFRGAVPEYLITYQEYFDIFRIETNYRSDAAIVNAANSLISHNANRIEKTMKPVRGNEKPVVVINNTDSEALTKFISRANLGDMAVLARNHFLLKKLSKLMDEKNIKHTYVGDKGKLVESESFRRFHAFLKLIVNPMDNFSFLLVRDMVGISRQEYAAIRYQSVQQSKSHFQVWIENGPGGWGDWFRDPDHTELTNVVDYLADRLPMGTALINDFIYDNTDMATTAESYLTWLATYDTTDEIEDAAGIQLMTIHAAKGLEFPTVVIAGCNDEILPSKQSINDIDKIDDERRLMYVAITRAVDQLILTVRPEISEFNGKERINPASRFLGEAQVGG